MRLIYLLVILLILLIATNAHGATKQELKEIVRVKAAHYQVSAPLLEQIITCESQWNPSVQSRHRYGFNNKRLGIVKGTQERSYGLVQISIPHNPKITKEMAMNPEFAVDFLAKNVANNKGHLWSCFPKPMKQIKPSVETLYKATYASPRVL